MATPPKCRVCGKAEWGHLCVRARSERLMPAPAPRPDAPPPQPAEPSKPKWGLHAQAASEEMKHGSPADRGSADAYYWRRPWPHKMVRGRQIAVKGKERADYLSAYVREEARKDWGDI